MASGAKNTVEKGENSGEQHFLHLLSTVFSTLIYSKREIIILAIFNLSFANAFSLVISKILPFGKYSLFFTKAVPCQTIQFNPIPNNKFLDMTKLKAYADDKLTHYHTMPHFDALKIYS